MHYLIVITIMVAAATVPPTPDEMRAAPKTFAAAEALSGSGFTIAAHAVVPGGIVASRSKCFGMSSILGQPVPGYSSGGTFSVISGYLSAAPITGRDEIYFNGFEGCGP